MEGNAYDENEVQTTPNIANHELNIKTQQKIFSVAGGFGQKAHDKLIKT